MTGFSRSAGLLCLLLACFLASSDALIHEKYRNLCGGSPLIQRKHEKTLQWLVKNVGEGALAISTSPQNKAACWMFRENKKFTAQRFALGVFYFGTKGTMWEINTDWMSDKHECSWYGITCSYFKTVLGLDLGFIKVDGVIPRELGLLTSLREIDLHGNDLQGVIPHKMMFGLKKLESLRLHMNGFFGAFHKEITNMSNLKEISMFGNYMGGTIPKELASLKKLGKYNEAHVDKESKDHIPSRCGLVPGRRCCGSFEVACLSYTNLSFCSLYFQRSLISTPTCSQGPSQRI
jgi:hypothetical protein